MMENLLFHSEIWVDKPYSTAVPWQEYDSSGTFIGTWGFGLPQTGPYFLSEAVFSSWKG
jgi:hypothetical protein